MGWKGIGSEVVL